MPELTIKYRSKKTLKVLKQLAKFFHFSIISNSNKEPKKFYINGVTILKSNPSIDINEGIEFTNKFKNSKHLREEAWQRLK